MRISDWSSDVCSSDLEDSITGDYLAGRREVPVPSRRSKGNGKFLTVKGARANNLQNVDAKIPLGTFTCITGVSGSGKSTLTKIGERRGGKECGSTCRSRWSPYH